MHGTHAGYGPWLAVDGNPSPNFYHGSCIHTTSSMFPTWGVDLQTMSIVHYVAAQRRGGAPAHGMVWWHNSKIAVFATNQVELCERLYERLYLIEQG